MAEVAIEQTAVTRKKAQRGGRLRPPAPFKHENPNIDKGKVFVTLGQTDLIRGVVQCVKSGEGDNNLHSHTGMDSFWMVLKGEVTFYGPEKDQVMGVYGPHEGLIMPRNNAYWFASTGEQDLELLQVTGLANDVKNERVNLEPERAGVGPGKTIHVDGRVK